MRTVLMMFTAAIGVSFVLSQASAGSCTQEIQSYEKQVSKFDAGMGPTQPTSSGTSAGNTGSTSKAGKVPGTEATATMNQTVEGKATSPQDVEKQNQGQPTAADSTKPESAEPAAGPATLEQARTLDRAGKEAECMAVMQKLKAKAP